MTRDEAEANASLFDPDVERAIQASHQAHAGQLRRGGAGVPYHTHPYHVALLLARSGAPSHVLVAALLHDAVEDSDDWTLARVGHEFGARVAALVDELSEDKALSWTERKEHGIAHVASMSPEAVTIKCADQLHNLSTLATELESTSDPTALWSKFNGGREATLRNARLLTDALAEHAPTRLANALDKAYRRFEHAAIRSHAIRSQTPLRRPTAK
ncbi:MAG: HD domain-containing protein [Planctomycetota bacterium]